jgi:hypothetical protein
VALLMYWQSVSISDEFNFIAYQSNMNFVLCFSYTRGVRHTVLPRVCNPSTAAPNGHVVSAPDDR